MTLLTETLPGGLALLTLNRPAAANALNTALAEAITSTFNSLPPATRALVLTGAGSRAFCAGADLKERQGMDESAWQAQHHVFETALAAVRACPVPVIAAANGAAYGGGLELALACDFIYAADTARFALTEAGLGIMPGLGGTQVLPRAIGERAAKEMLFTGLPMNAKQAQAVGLVNKVFAADALLPAVLETAQRIAANAPLSLRAIKQAVLEGAILPLEEALAVELKHYAPLLATQDRVEGIAAFNEKRKPIFIGE